MSTDTVPELDTVLDLDVVNRGRRLLDEAMAQLGHEESKGAALMASLTVSSGALVGGFFAGKWSPGHLPALAAAVWWAGALCVLTSLALVGRSVLAGDLPDRRVTAPHRDSDARAWLVTLLQHPEEDVAARLWRVRRVIGVKRRLTRLGVALAGGGALACLAGGIFGTL